MPTWGKTQRCLRRWLVICFKKFFIDKILVTQKWVFKRNIFFIFPIAETPTCYREKSEGVAFRLKAPRDFRKLGQVRQRLSQHELEQLRPSRWLNFDWIAALGFDLMTSLCHTHLVHQTFYVSLGSLSLGVRNLVPEKLDLVDDFEFSYWEFLV